MDELQPGAGRKCILVVDDSEDSAETLARLVKLEGHFGHVAFNGASALASAQSLKPDAVLLDLTLPDMDGTEVAAKIRATDALRSTILIAVSGYGLSPCALPLFDGQITKPADVATILDLIATIDQRRRPRTP